VRVVLRSSPYGGVTAVALLPGDLVVAPVVAQPAVAAEPFEPFEPARARVEARLEAGAVGAPRGVPERPVLSVVPSDDAEPEAGSGPVQRRAVPPPDRGGSSEVAAARTAGGLPKRVRQQSLAPQLQHDETVVMSAEEVEAPEATRTPEQLRRMMSSFQAGTVRGRHEARGDGEQR
jgi:hypothetical protein